MRDDDDHLVPGGAIRIEGRPGGPLAGLTFAAKDLFDVAGRRTGGGNPDWAKGRQPAERHAWAVETLLGAGATLVGKTVTDEVSLGLLGENPFDGTPLNPRAPDRVPGGSSSGSASAVARGAADTALGTDTGGSVRVPASYCGLFGVRPTHGRLPLDGMAPQAPTSDTTGWFADDGATFARVSAAMLGEAAGARPSKLVVATDAFGFADPAARDALRPMVDRLARLVGPPREDLLAPPGLALWGRAQRTIQIREAWETFRPWVEAENPRLAFLVARTLLFGASVAPADLAAANLTRDEARGRLDRLVPPGTVLCLPTTPGPAPLKGSPIPVLDRVRDRITCLAALGGLAGHPQVNLPGATVEGAPVGLSVVGARGEDAGLVAVAEAWEDAA